MELKDRVQARMDEKAWKLADLARESAVAKGYLSEILSGKAKRPSAETLYAVAQSLGTSVADLLGRSSNTEVQGPETASETLMQFAQEAQLPDDDVHMLASIRFRNEQPKSKEARAAP